MNTDFWISRKKMINTTTRTNIVKIFEQTVFTDKKLLRLLHLGDSPCLVFLLKNKSTLHLLKNRDLPF
jgi:hypothetical protein